MWGGICHGTDRPASPRLRSKRSASRLVARRDAVVAGEWLEPYVAARDVLARLVPRLRAGEAVEDEPEPLRRLRTARDRLLGSSGEGAEERRRPDAPDGADVTPEDREIFRREAGALIDRMASMAVELASAPEDRRTSRTRPRSR